MREGANDELPQGWTNTPIGNLVDLNPKADLPDGTKVGFVPMPSIGTGFVEPIRFESRLWEDVKKGYTHFSDGDVLLAKITPCFENGKGAIVKGLPNGVGAGSTEYFVCRSKKDVLEPRYLHAFFKTPAFMWKAESQMSGSVGHKRVPKEHIVATNLPLAPLAEQKRIADKLEAVLGRVDACRTRLDRVPDLLKRFRQSVLAAATSGRLTEDWREEHSVSLDDSWLNTTLSAICSSISDGDHLPPPQTADGIPFLTIGNISSGRLDFSSTRFVAESYFKNIKGTRVPCVGDTLYSVVGATIGIAVLVDTDRPFCFQRHIAILKPSESTVPKFLHLLMASPTVFREAWTQTTGTAQPTLPLGNLRSLSVSSPPLPEQVEIVRRVEALFAFADQIEARLTRARAQVERLTPATLAKAFRGELVPQDPNDESAIVLLERVRCRTIPDRKPKKP